MQHVLQSTSLKGLLPCLIGDATPGLRRIGAPKPEWSTEFRLLIHEDLRRAARVRVVVDALHGAFQKMLPVFAGTRKESA